MNWSLCKAAAETELPKSHWADTRSGQTHRGKAELPEAEGELSPRQGQLWDWQLLLALAAGARLVTGEQSGNYSSTDATGLARLSIYSCLPAQLS